MPFLTTWPQVRCTFFTEKGNVVATSDFRDTTKRDQIVSVNTHKSLAEAAGRFQIVMTCEEYSQNGGWRNLLRAGDLVVIEMGPDRPQPKDTYYGRLIAAQTDLGGAEPVMIGTIDDLRFSSSIGGDGRPEQRITVTGRDFGKYLIDDMILFYPWWNPVKAILKWVDTVVEFPKVGWAGTPAAIFDLILNKWIFDQFDVEFDITQKGPVTALGTRKLSQILRYVLDGDTPILPYSQNLMSYEGSPWAMMQTVQNAPWYTLHLDVRRQTDITLLTNNTSPAKLIDSAKRPATPSVAARTPTTWNTSLGTWNSQVALLYYRTPWSNRHYDDWVHLPTRVITDDDIVNFDLGRTVDDVFNRWQVLAAWPGLNRTLGAEIAEKLRATELERRFGLRPRVLKTTFAYDSRDVSGNRTTELFTELARDWDILAENFLNGRLTIKGMAAVKVGDRLHYDQPKKTHRGVDFYVEEVTQEWQALTSWRTTLGVTRGQPHRDASTRLFDEDGNVTITVDSMAQLAVGSEL
jgi:hypothetical protein